MNIPNNEWVLAGDGADTSLVLQNVGNTRIGMVFADTKPADDAFDLATDEFFILQAGSEPFTIKDLDTFSRNVYVRSIGPIAGRLAVEANT